MENSNKSQLTDDGLIPAYTVCPFRNECPWAIPNKKGKILCSHKGVEHKVNFSCGIARIFDLFL